MNKKKRNGKKPTTSFLRTLGHYQVSLLKHAKPEKFFWSARPEMPPGLYSSILDFIDSIDLLSKKLFSNPFPGSPQELSSCLAFGPMLIERELRWALAFISRYKQELSVWVQRTIEYEHLFIVKDYLACEQLLDQIQNDFGYSLWLIKNRVALLQESKGLESQKRYAADIENQSNGVVACVTFLTSFRAEATLSTFSFRQQLERFVSDLDVSDGLKSYIIFHVLPDPILDLSRAAEILNFESPGAIVDYYETLLELARIVVSTTDLSSLRFLIGSLRQLNEQVQDSRITSIIRDFCEHNESSIEMDIRALDAFDALLSGDYELALSIADSVLSDVTDNFDVMEIGAQALALSNHQLKLAAPVAPVISLMCKVLCKESDSEDAAEKLTKLAWNLPGRRLAYCLLSFIGKEMSSNPLGTTNEFVRLAASCMREPHPLRLLKMDREEAIKRYALTFGNKFGFERPSAVFVALFSEESQGNFNFSKLSWEESLLLPSISNLHTRHYNTALLFAKKLLPSIHSVYRQRSIRIVAYCLQHTGRIQDCIQFVTQTYVNFPKFRSILPIAEIVELIDSRIRKSLSSNISLPILYDIHVKSFGGRFENLRNYAYEDFLQCHGFTRPSELKNCRDGWDAKLLAYFLRYICIESVMDCSVSFEGSFDLAQERIEVCRLASEIDPENVSDYQTEIKDIYRRMMIKRKSREIEYSKIYVDIEGIKRLADKSIREQYNRYIAFLRDGMDRININLRQQVKEKTDRGDIIGILSLSLPENEMSILFKNMIEELRDLYVRNAEHGLDSYLSVRIRHGTLSGQLRSPLEAEHLITQRDSITGVYRSNQYWIKRTGLHDVQLQNALSNAFVGFSKDFDDLIQEMISGWIQVKTRAGEKGVFSFLFTEPEKALLSSRLTENTTFEEFLDIVLNHLDALLEERTARMRLLIETVAKPRSNTLLNVLQGKIDQISFSYNKGTLMAALGSARTELQLAFDRVREWFRPTKKLEAEPFTIEEAISVGVNSLKTYYPEFQTQICVSEDRLASFSFTGNLRSFADILFIIFENIARHSKTPGPPTAEVDARIEDNFIVLSIENIVAKNSITSDLRDKLDRIKRAMNADDYKQSMTTEGGTGFHKIKKILFHDFVAKSSGFHPSLDFGVKGDDRFFVRIAIPFTPLTL